VLAVWKRRSRPAPEDLVQRDDIAEARAAREDAVTGLIKLREQEGLVQKISNVLIDRQGHNHYMELLYTHIPGSAS
jgi:hypothetical protein